MHLTRYLLQFEVLTDCVLPGHLGSLIRGLWGEVMKGYDTELYQRFFNPQIDMSNPAYKYVSNNPPPPFMIRVHKTHEYLRQGATFNLTFTLFGNYSKYWIQLNDIWALITTGNPNAYHLKLKLKEFKPLTCPVTGNVLFDYKDYTGIKPEKNNYTFDFKSPFALNHNQQLIADFSFDRFFGYIYRRLFILDAIYGNKSMEEKYVKDIIRNIHPVSIDLRHITIYRSPSRQDKYPMRNWQGKIRYTGDFSKSYPIIKYGEYLHTGANTVFGFGKYVLK